jgi:hypothetical protein
MALAGVAYQWRETKSVMASKIINNRKWQRRNGENKYLKTGVAAANGEAAINMAAAARNKSNNVAKRK